MAFYFLLQSLLVMLTATTVKGIQTHFVYWNSSNPIFRADNTDHVVDVNTGNLPWEYDQLKLVCPNSDEQHVIYSVSREDYIDCRVTSPRPKIVAICNRPERSLYFTITFRSFSPTPGGLEFKPGHTYYLISTSTARDLHRRAGGYCSTHNMRMIFKVAVVQLKLEAQKLDRNREIEVYRADRLTSSSSSSSRTTLLDTSALLAIVVTFMVLSMRT